MKGVKIKRIPTKRETVVYDLEVKDNHNFFVNKFLLHNCAVFVAKKKYYARVRDSEGTRYPTDAPKIKVMGLEIIKSSSPLFSQKYLKQAIPLILDKDEANLREWLAETKQKFTEVDLNEIAAVGAVSRLDYDLENDTVPIGSRAALVHNRYIKELGLEDRYAPIQAGDKCKRLYLTTPNPFNSNIVAFTNDGFVEELRKHGCVDYDTNFEKTFLSPLKIMTAVLNYNLERETQAIDDW